MWRVTIDSLHVINGAVPLQRIRKRTWIDTWKQFTKRPRYHVRLQIAVIPRMDPEEEFPERTLWNDILPVMDWHQMLYSTNLLMGLQNLRHRQICQHGREAFHFVFSTWNYRPPSFTHGLLDLYQHFHQGLSRQPTWIREIEGTHPLTIIIWYVQEYQQVTTCLKHW